MSGELPSLAAVEQRAAAAGLLLRLQCRPLLALQPLRVVVALPPAMGRGWVLPKNASGAALVSMSAACRKKSW